MTKEYIGLHAKYPLYLSDFNKTSISRQIIEKYWISESMKIYPLGDELVPCGQRNGRTDMTKLTVALRNFANAPKYC